MSSEVETSLPHYNKARFLHFARGARFGRNDMIRTRPTPLPPSHGGGMRKPTEPPPLEGDQGGGQHSPPRSHKNFPKNFRKTLDKGFLFVIGCRSYETFELSQLHVHASVPGRNARVFGDVKNRKLVHLRSGRFPRAVFLCLGEAWRPCVIPSRKGNYEVRHG